MLLTTQYLDEADELADDIVVIDHGQVIATGTPDELKARTGAQSLAVRPASPADLPTVVSVVAELARAEPEVERPAWSTAPVADPAVLPAVVRRLDDAGVVVTELTLRSASLNEVFLSLTGHPADEDDDAGDADRRRSRRHDRGARHDRHDRGRRPLSPRVEPGRGAAPDAHPGLAHAGADPAQPVGAGRLQHPADHVRAAVHVRVRRRDRRLDRATT